MKRKLTLIFLALVLIMTSNVPMSLAKDSKDSVGANESEEFPYIGYQDGGYGNSLKLYIVDKNNPKEKRVVYCFNKSLHWPDTKGTTNDLAYKKPLEV